MLDSDDVMRGFRWFVVIGFILLIISIMLQMYKITSNNNPVSYKYSKVYVVDKNTNTYVDTGTFVLFGSSLINIGSGSETTYTLRMNDGGIQKVSKDTYDLAVVGSIAIKSVGYDKNGTICGTRYELSSNKGFETYK